MRIPRWTTYPAIALLLLIAVAALPSGRKDRGAAQRSRSRAYVTGDALQSSMRMTKEERRKLIEFLPIDHVKDGSVEYTKAVQEAIHACAGGTLEIPEYPVSVGELISDK